MNTVGAIIIAAGSSSRLGQPKQLLIFEGETLLQRAVRIANESGTSPVLVVLGAHRAQIQSQMEGSRASIVANPDWEGGMASSIREGVRALEAEAPGTGGALLMICDQPAVSAEHLGRMLVAFQQNPFSAIASVYAGKRGIPAIFPRGAFADLLALQGDQGARGLLLNPSRMVIEIPLENGELDIDRPEDLAHLRTS